MTTLEGRYRRLLGVYPADHRRAYEQEMLGVLMAGSKPGQRFPAFAEALDLLRAGFLARIGHGGRGLRSKDWRDACAVVALLTAVVLLAVAGRRLYLGAWAVWIYDEPMRAYGVDGLLMLDVALRTTAWLAVVVAILTGLRRTAAGLGVVALLVELGALISWLPADTFRAFHVAWAPVLMVVCVVALFVSIPGRSAFQVLGRRGTAQVAARKRVWRRVLALLAPALAVPVTQMVTYRLVDISTWPTVTAPMILMLAGMLTVVPLVTLLSGVALVERREAVSRGDTEVM